MSFLFTPYISFPSLTGCTGSLISTLNLGAYYKFDSNALDSSGNGLDLSVSGSPTYTTGVFGSAVSLNGTDQFFEHADDVAFEGSGGSISVFAWVQINDWATSTQSYIGSKRAVGFGWRFWLEQGFFGSTFASTNAFQATTIPTGGTWVHMGFTYDNNTVNFYQDGSQVGVGNVIGSQNIGAIPGISIGKNNLASSGYFDGLMDEWSCWRRVLTDNEISIIYSGTCPLIA